MLKKISIVSFVFGVIFTIFAFSYANYSSFSNVVIWDEYDNRKEIKTKSQFKVENDFVSFVVSREGHVYQLPWDNGAANNTKRFAVKFNSGLQIENAVTSPTDDLKTANIYRREWQLPKNAKFLIKQYQTDTSTGAINYNIQPTKYVVTATSDTVISLSWIQEGFYPSLVDEPTSTVLSNETTSSTSN